MIKARPSINGNTRADFESAWIALNDAKSAIEEALRLLLCDVANGRNYQHLNKPDDATISDRRRIQSDALTIANIIGTMQGEIFEALDGAERSPVND